MQPRPTNRATDTTTQCREFSPLLEEFAAKHGDDVAVVFVSHDHDERSFEQYSAHMPHVLRIPWSEFEMRQNISAEYGIYALPTLQIVGPDGASITNWGRAAVMRNPDRCVEAWKNGKSGASFLELLGF